MPDRERDLERELRDLGASVDYPRTPDIAGSARRRIEEEEEARARRRGLFWLPALSPRWAVAAMFVIVLAVPALSPNARDALSGLFITGGGFSAAGGGAARSADEAGKAGEDKILAGDAPQSAGQAGSQAAPEGEPVPESSGDGQGGATAASSADAAPASEGSCSLGPPMMIPADHAKRITLEEARDRAAEANCPFLLPRKPAGVRPDAVYKTRIPVGRGFSFVYRARPGLPAAWDTDIGMVFTQFPEHADSKFRLTIAEKQTIEEVNVGGERGSWVTDVHLDPVTSGRIESGAIASGQRRRPLVNVLVWNQEGLALRLESNLTREEAVRIAEAVR